MALHHTSVNMNRLFLKFLFCATTLLIFTASSFAARVTITVGDDFFSPKTVTITNGDTVVWTNTGFASHTSTSGTSCSPSGQWNSPLMGHAGSYTITNFNFGAGNYPYFCTPHCSFGMTGLVVVVSAANIAPTVTITNPVANAAFAAPATFPIQASASDSDGSITNVQFLVNGLSIGNATTAPYNATANNLNNGTYTLTAIATDNSGAKQTNQISVFVTTITLSSPTVNAGQFQLTANGLTTGKTNIVQGSALLNSDWTSIATNVASADQATITGVDTTNSALRFFRLIQLP